MIPNIYTLKIELHEATFFASHELGPIYFTEPLLGNYALAYALGIIKSPYNRYDVGYADDLPELNQKGIYVTPAWITNNNPTYRIESFNCQAESFVSAMIPNAVAEVAGRQYLKALIDGKRIRANNRPQIGTLKMLCPGNRFSCHVVSNEDICLPAYIRLGKFMSKAKVLINKIAVKTKKFCESEHPMINPIDLDPESKVLFGDTINIHPSPLIRKAQIKSHWWLDSKDNPVVPAGLEFRGI